MRTFIPAALLIILLVGCGGGGGGGSAVGPSTPPALGTAVLPGATLVVTKTSGTVAAGATITIRATTADPGIATVAMLVGNDWAGATTAAATVVAAGAGIWDATVTLPSPLPAGYAILVRLTFSDGNVVESSRDDFLLQ